MTNIQQLFQTPDPERLAKLAGVEAPSVRYVIAITPRSGSSYLCDILKATHAFGRPGEFLAAEFIPNILRNIPARDPDEYWNHVFKGTQTKNSVAGLKASWFQFMRFRNALSDKTLVRSVRYISLQRRDIYAQAVSLYKATATGVFHTNIEHQAERKEKLRRLEYSFEEIDKWYRHIVAQEEGWTRFFDRAGIQPLHLMYEDIERDVEAVVGRICRFLKLPAPTVRTRDSVFKRVSDERNLPWARDFAIELARRGASGGSDPLRAAPDGA